MKVWLVVLFINAYGDLQKESYPVKDMDSCEYMAPYVQSILEETIPSKTEIRCEQSK